MRSMIVMIKSSEQQDVKKRQKVQDHFWNEVGSIEHVSLPKLKDAVRKEFRYKDDRSVQAQIELMQTEARIKIESKVKVWIKPPVGAPVRVLQHTMRRKRKLARARSID